MDRSWMKANRLGAEYDKGMEAFFQYAREKLPNNNKFYCPCVNCLNRELPLLIDEIRNHLVVRAFAKVIPIGSGFHS
ncbi:unnamed protein product [Lathyrus sativus]|nr:unnamed protein product [Lathyrus sativus]